MIIHSKKNISYKYLKFYSDQKQLTDSKIVFSMNFKNVHLLIIRGNNLNDQKSIFIVCTHCGNKGYEWIHNKLITIWSENIPLIFGLKFKFNNRYLI